MSDKNPCPICGDDSEYLHFLDLCAKHANGIWRENEVRILTDIYKSMDFVQVVRCGDCRYLCDDGSTWGCGWHCSCLCTNDGFPPDGFCAWGERKEN